jgi:hypothetical protein
LKPLASLSRQWGWKELHHFSEQLIQSATLDRQCELIHTVLLRQLQAEAKLWLSGIFYPLRGETIPDCVNYGKPVGIVKRAITNKKISLGKRQAGSLIAAVPMFSQPANRRNRA